LKHISHIIPDALETLRIETGLFNLSVETLQLDRAHHVEREALARPKKDKAHHSKLAAQIENELARIAS